MSCDTGTGTIELFGLPRELAAAALEQASARLALTRAQGVKDQVELEIRRQENRLHRETVRLDKMLRDLAGGSKS